MQKYSNIRNSFAFNSSMSSSEGLNEQFLFPSHSSNMDKISLCGFSTITSVMLYAQHPLVKVLQFVIFVEQLLEEFFTP